jgi:hypothetical protein
MFRVELGPRRQSHQAPPGIPALAVCAFPASGPPVQIDFATQTTEAPARLRRGPREGPPFYSSHRTQRIADAVRGTVCDCLACEGTFQAHPRCILLASLGQLGCSPDGSPSVITQITDCMALVEHIRYSAPSRPHSLPCNFDTAFRIGYSLLPIGDLWIYGGFGVATCFTLTLSL